MKVLCANNEQDIMFTADLLAYTSDNNYMALYLRLKRVQFKFQ